MCSICGMIDFNDTHAIDLETALCMSKKLAHRGVDQSGVFMSENAALSHNRLCVIDIDRGRQPMTVSYRGSRYTIVYNGEIYNCAELRADLQARGISFRTNCDTELVLYACIVYGSDAPSKLNGIFAFAVYDETKKQLFLARDRFGVKPLFYTVCGSTLLFASEIKSLLAHPAVTAELDCRGLWELLFLSPVRIGGHGVFRGISELEPAQCGTFDRDGLRLFKYWSLRAKRLEISAADAAEQTEFLVIDAINRQLVSDVPLCAFLSGGLDSSVITAVAARQYQSRGERLATFSFEYEGNRESFTRSRFLPSGDDEYASLAAEYFNTEHTILTAPSRTVAEYLAPSMRYRDFPAQADIDSSLLYFCEQVKQTHTVALSGECSDEVFGGYPWFYRPEMLNSGFFPFIHAPMERISLFDSKLVRPEDGYEYISSVYRDSIAGCPLDGDDSDSMRCSRIATWLSLNYFCTSLLERKDRMSMASSLEVRVPFADHRIIEFVYNVPWEIKFENGVEKALLRKAMGHCLPERIVNRKKNPYPKTHNPEYARIVEDMLERRLKGGSRLAEMLDAKAMARLAERDDVTWFGQLCTKPQLYAWLIQLDCWLEEYNVNLIS